ncbi:hypothetical protein [Sciscionella marina]|uniref:hypothetical protein n=1 Tax=Sciscionella marina TaxID=508770 RepID=UPI000374EC65|nr:hypothetical protein [Sciscionella marina]
MHFLVKVGVLELAVGALTGWAMVYVTRTPRAQRLRAGLRDARRIRQGHIEMLMQGTVLTAFGAAVPDPPLFASILLSVVCWTAPLAFFPLAFRPEWGETRLYRYVDNASLIGLSVGFVLFAVSVLAS